MSELIHVATAITPGVYEDIVKVLASSFVRNSSYTLHIYCLNFDDTQYAHFKSNFAIDGNIDIKRISYTSEYTTSGTGLYTDVLDSLSCKFKIFSQPIDCTYFLWLDADTLIMKNIDNIVSTIKHGEVAGVPKNVCVPLRAIEFNCGVILLRNLGRDLLTEYETFLDEISIDLDARYLMCFADEKFITRAHTGKVIMPSTYNSVVNAFSKKAFIQHFGGMYVPWEVKLSQMPTNAKQMGLMWLDEYSRIKHALSADFCRQVDELLE